MGRNKCSVLSENKHVYLSVYKNSLKRMCESSPAALKTLQGLSHVKPRFVWGPVTRKEADDYEAN